MKRIYSFFLMLVATLCAATAQTTITWASADAWDGVADKATEISYKQDPYTLMAGKVDGQTNPTVNANAGDLRIYAKGVLTVNTTGENMKRIVFNISTAGKKRLTDITASEGTVVIDNTAWTVTWTGDSKNVEFTVARKPLMAPKMRPRPASSA